jgi:hypothetical protein
MRAISQKSYKDRPINVRRTTSLHLSHRCSKRAFACLSRRKPTAFTVL